MGTFAWMFKEKGSSIPDNKKDEFVKKVEKIFQSGGMMNIEWIQLYGKKIPMLRLIEMSDKGMYFFYNYFADEIWEDAGFDMKDCRVWSNKIGWSYFHKTVVAAYVLEELYMDGISATMVDCDPVTSGEYVGWINYLFQEMNFIKNYDAWRLFEAIHYSEETYVRMDWFEFGSKRDAFIGGCEISAVLNGYKDAIKIYDAKERGEIEELILRAMKKTVKSIHEYRNTSKRDKECQIQLLIEKIRLYYESDDKEITDNVSDEDKVLKDILVALHISDAPAFVLRVISEIYELDFWELWDKIRDVAKRKMKHLYGSDNYYVPPISTEKFFRQSSDDMIIYWKQGGDIRFSEDLRDWFKSIREQYDNMVDDTKIIDNVLKYIVDLLDEANENYYSILCFYDFFEESLENMQDKRYQTLWRIFEQMIHDPEMKKAGDVIFVPDGPEHENEGLHYWDEQPKRRLIGNWDLMSPSKKNNKARVTFRRYMALVANKALRNTVFGF